MSDGELFFQLSEDRLRRRGTWAAGAIAFTVVMPYEVIDGQPQFIWQLFDELPLGAVIAGLAPLFAGIAVLVATRLCRRATSLAIIVVAALAAMALSLKIGADASAWGLLPLPKSFTSRGGLALLSLALTAAGTTLATRAPTRRVAKMALIASVVAALVFYALPGRGEAAGVTVLRGLSLLGDMPSLRFQLGLVTVAVVALWPAIIALIGLGHIWRPPTRSFSGLSMAALFGFPLILMMLLFSWYVRASPGGALFGALGAALEITAVLALLASAIEVIGHGVLSGEADLPMPHGWSPARMAMVSAAIVALFGGAQWWLARPPDKGVSWNLVAPSDAGDRVFGELVVAWSDARWVWDQRVREDSSATELLEVKKRGRALVESAREVDSRLGASMDALANAAWRLDTSSRTWYRLVADVNETCRALGLPYYLDPRVSIDKTKDGLRRSFLVDSYRVERARQWDVDGERYATLHVRGFGTLRGGHQLGLLGFSRDTQPFALVVIDANDAHLDELTAMASDNPPHCGDALDAERARASLRCGTMLRALLAEGALVAVTGKVERHELQHQIDGPLLRIAKPLLRKLAGYSDEAQERGNRELSAYVAELTGPGGRLGLVVPFRFALLTDRGTYHHAAVLLFEALSERSVRTARGAVDPVALADVFDELVSMTDEALAARSAAAWEELFGDPLPSVDALEETSAPSPAAAP